MLLFHSPLLNQHTFQPVEQFDILEIPMMALVPISGWKAWRYHMAEKSPSVQPTRHLSVLTPARFHVGLDDQKSTDVTAGAGVVVLLLLHPAFEDSDSHCRRLVDVANAVRGLAANDWARVAARLNDAARNEARLVNANILWASGHGFEDDRYSRDEDEMLMSRFSMPSAVGDCTAPPCRVRQ